MKRYITLNGVDIHEDIRKNGPLPYWIDNKLAKVVDAFCDLDRDEQLAGKHYYIDPVEVRIWCTEEEEEDA